MDRKFGLHSLWMIPTACIIHGTLYIGEKLDKYYHYGKIPSSIRLQVIRKKYSKKRKLDPDFYYLPLDEQLKYIEKFNKESNHVR